MNPDIFEVNSPIALNRYADVVMRLRIQKERMEEGEVPQGEEFFKNWGLTSKRLNLADKEAIVMHPRPMNRGIEIASDVHSCG